MRRRNCIYFDGAAELRAVPTIKVTLPPYRLQARVRPRFFCFDEIAHDVPPPAARMRCAGNAGTAAPVCFASAACVCVFCRYLCVCTRSGSSCSQSDFACNSKLVSCVCVHLSCVWFEIYTIISL